MSEILVRPTKKWTKKDTKTLIGALDAFWLRRRPLSDSLTEHAKAGESVRKMLADEKNRREVIINDLRGFRNLYARRYAEYCESIGNAIARPLVWGGSTASMIERFTSLARDEDSSMKLVNVLIDRVRSESLPSEVLFYDPTAK